jgi:DNA-binding GntR family transcriptional regulator
LAGRHTALLAKPERIEIAGKLRALNQQLKDIVRSRPAGVGGIFDIDRSFHRTIIDAGAGPRLTVLHKAIEPQAERYWRLYASSIVSDLHLSIAEHEVIIQALLAGDADATERGLQANWMNGCDRLARVIDMFGERGSW